MILIKRILEETLKERFEDNKVFLLFGPRRVGKTVLVKEIYRNFAEGKMYLNAEDEQVNKLLEERSISNYRQLFGQTKLLIIDEAQIIKDIGMKLKLIIDEIEGIKVIATGSSSFDILNLAGEPLTGRSRTFTLFPLAQMEFSQTENLLETTQMLEARLIYGSYPELVKYENPEHKKEYLFDLVNAYLLKDILAIEGLRNAHKMKDLLKLIALQIGNELAYDELGKQLGLSKNTVEKYLDLLTKIFVIYRLDSYSGNLRKELRKSKKYYFYDNGVRNAIISEFSPLSLRNDTGQLWENYLISERIKKHSYQRKHVNTYFWRTYDQQEIDLVEESDRKLNAYEIKWKSDKFKVPAAWKNAYPDATIELINNDNYLSWIR